MLRTLTIVVLACSVAAALAALRPLAQQVYASVTTPVARLGTFVDRNHVAFQRSDWDCGRAAVLTLYPNARNVADRIRVVAGRGSSMSDLLAALNTIDDKREWRFGRAHSGGWPKTPFVALLQFGHYVVVDSVAPERIDVLDPAEGHTRYKPPAFRTLWSGYYLSRAM